LPVVPPDEVHVWVVHAAAAERVGRFLDDAERERAARFRFEHDRALYTVAHGALRHVLGDCLGQAPESLRFAVAEHGKPFLVDRPDVSFNIAHSGDRALVAVAAGRAVGVDVEHVRRVQNEEAVARRVMTDGELSRYLALGDEERRAFLLWAWARKEALVKASGLGVRASLTTISCEPDGDDPFSVVDLEVPGYAAAVAAAGHEWRPVPRHLDGL
jgi:4'-phosphopantetheinyl transferase